MVVLLVRIVRGYELKDSGEYKPVQYKADENDITRLQGSIVSADDAQCAAGNIHTLQLAFQRPGKAYVGHEYGYDYYIGHAPFARLKSKVFDDFVFGNSSFA